VTDDLRTITAPIDVIHGDSPVETMAALLHFSDTPAVFVCHGWGRLARATPHFPRILRYVAVDDTCADRLLLREGIAPGKVSVILNGVDLAAFQQRGPLPAKPRRAVVFGNAAHELTFLPTIREACRRAAIDVDVVSGMTGTAVSDPQSILGGYDLAFAKAKCAIEAMACGLAVVLCDDTGVGGMVRAADLDRLRRLNFGIRSLQKPLSADAILAELALYDPDDARLVSNSIRQTASSNVLHQSLFSLYQAVVEEHARAGGEGRLGRVRRRQRFFSAWRFRSTKDGPISGLSGRRRNGCCRSPWSVPSPDAQSAGWLLGDKTPSTSRCNQRDQTANAPLRRRDKVDVVHGSWRCVLSATVDPHS
jgi:hypothetical protein